MGNIKQHFIAVKTDKGRKYILDIYEVVKKGEVKRIGITSAQYGAHRGETSEAYNFLTGCCAIKPGILKAIQVNRHLTHHNPNCYYSYSYADNFGLLIELL